MTPRAAQGRAALLKDALGLEALVIEVQEALAHEDRDLTLERLNELRELARHAFALAQVWQRGEDG